MINNNFKIMNKKRIILTISFTIMTIMFWSVYWVWLSWNWVKWIGESENINRFNWPALFNGISSYKDTFTWLEWEADDWWLTHQWAVNNTYTEPVWNWSNYDYPIARVEWDYPAFKYCTDKWWLWRLPTRRDFFSIATKEEKNATWYNTLLPSFTYPQYLSSTEVDFETDRVWYMTYYWKLSDFNKNGTNMRVICVHDS
jgi:hypothetical protein